MKWEYLNTSGQFGFAHRGGNTVAPENTVAAFANAQRLGFRFLETDAHVTTDGVLVAFHDSNLERITGKPGKISERSWAELSEIRLDGGHSVPTMSELFETFPDAHFNIDPKENDAVAPLAEVIQAHNAIDRVGIGAFSDRRISTMRELLGPRLCTSPGPIHTAVILGSAFLSRTVTFGHGMLQVPRSVGPVDLTPAMVKRAHAAGLQVHVWTINEREEMVRLLDMGVNAIMTDQVELLAEVFAERGCSPS
jgi:glycerophosphoryl diester phosphodiesterase